MEFLIIRISLTQEYSIVIKQKNNLKKFCKFIYIWTNEGKEKIKKESH